MWKKQSANIDRKREFECETIFCHSSKLSGFFLRFSLRAFEFLNLLSFTENLCLTQDGAVCIFPARDAQGSFHKGCSKAYHGPQTEFWCATALAGETIAQGGPCNMEICKAGEKKPKSVLFGFPPTT